MYQRQISTRHLAGDRKRPRTYRATSQAFSGKSRGYVARASYGKQKDHETEIQDLSGILLNLGSERERYGQSATKVSGLSQGFLYCRPSPVDCTAWSLRIRHQSGTPVLSLSKLKRTCPRIPSPRRPQRRLEAFVAPRTARTVQSMKTSHLGRSGTVRRIDHVHRGSRRGPTLQHRHELAASDPLHALHTPAPGDPEARPARPCMRVVSVGPRACAKAEGFSPTSPGRLREPKRSRALTLRPDIMPIVGRSLGGLGVAGGFRVPPDTFSFLGMSPCQVFTREVK